MPVQTIMLTEEQSRFIASQIQSGRYRDPAEVVNAGLQTLESTEREYQAKLTALRAAIAEGDAGGVVEGDPFARVLARLGLADADDR